MSSSELPLRVGLTGGIASGKSTVARVFRAEGLTVADADQVVADLYRPKAAGSKAVERLFGSGFLAADGAVDRDKLARHVFSDSEARGQLEKVIHPLVGQEFRKLIAEAAGPIVFEVPLIAETGGRGNYEVVVTVEADSDLRLRRAIARGHDEEDAKGRIAAQATTEQRTRLADYVIANNGSLEALEREAARVARILIHRACSQDRAKRGRDGRSRP